MLKSPIRSLALVLLTIGLTGCTQHTAWVSVGQIERSLPDRPVAVGFDVDETMICSTAIWYYLATNRDGPGGSNKYGAEIRKHPDFWVDANRLDGFSVPKERARELVEMHKRRGDRICIITSRPKTEGERLTETLRRAFKLDESVPVLFTNQRPKTEAMRAMKVEVFYGDADEDVRQAREVGARPIRFLRTMKCADDRLHVGALGEEVVEGSEVCVGFARAGAATRAARK